MLEPETDDVAELWHITKKLAYPYLPLEQARSLEEDQAFFREKLRPRCDVWVAEVAGRLAGFLAIVGSYVDRLYVLPGFQKQGVGTCLIQHAKALSPAGLKLHTHRKNTAARCFYEKHAFLAIHFGISPPPESEPDVELHWRPGLGRAPDQEIHVVPYDEAWPLQFEAERAVLQRVIGKFVVGTIEHIGSTAVPGLAAKPVIDIMAGVDNLEVSLPAIVMLEEIEYCYFRYHPDVMHWFCKPSPSFRTHHLHLVPFSSRLWMERIAFRDYLRNHASVAREYAGLKLELAIRHRFDREAYTDAKGAFVERILKLAMRESEP